MQVNGRFVENVTDSDASALIGFLENGGAIESITSPWQPISEGRGMATVSAIGEADDPTAPMSAVDSKIEQNGAHER